MSLFRDKQTAGSFSDTNERIYDFMDGKFAGVIATVDPNGMPNASVIYYSIDKSLTARFITKRNTRKSDNLKHNNHAVLLVYDEATQTTAEIIGEAEEIEELDEVHDTFRATLRASIHTSGNGVPPISKLSAGDYVGYRLVPKDVKMAVFARREVGDARHIYESANLTAATGNV